MTPTATGHLSRDGHRERILGVNMAMLFRRAEVSPAHEEIDVGFDDATQLEATSKHGSAWQVGDARSLGLSSRQALDPTEPSGPLPTPPRGTC
jgi:hypothetical protein